MTERQQRRLAELYRQASQETPPAHLDHAVMDLASKSLRRRLWSPFGGHWLAGAATVAVVVLSVLVVLTLPPAARRNEPEPGPSAPASQAPLMDLKRQSTPGRASPAPYFQELEVPETPAPANDADDAIPASKRVEKAESRARTKQLLVPLEEEAGLVAPPAVAGHYLWAGTFGERAQAQRLKAAVDALGMDCDIEELRTAAGGSMYRVRVGPYRDPAELEQAREQLAAHGIDATVAAPPE
jgi:cell division protein FtsN